MDNKREILLNPGPVTLSKSVREALQKPDLCHREKDFADMTLDSLQKISHIYETENTHIPVMLTGSGTAAVEAMLQSFSSSTVKSLIVANGVYGERMASMLTRQKKPFDIIKGNWTDPLDLQQTKEHLEKSKYSAVLTVHHETTTGRLNDISALSELAEHFHVPVMLDAVSSFGSEDISFKNLMAVAATGNKCLHGIPGISFVLAEKKLLEEGTTESVSLYLDLFEYYTAQKSGFSPFTQSVQALYALQAALNEFFALGGLSARKQLYVQRKKQVLTILEKHGIQTLINKSDFSSYLTSYFLPQNISKGYEALHNSLKEKGYTIYAGQGNFSGKIFRIAVMGDIYESEMNNLILHLDTFFGAQA